MKLDKFLAVVVCIALCSCGANHHEEHEHAHDHEHQHEHDHDHEHEHEHDHAHEHAEGVIHFSEHQAHEAGLETEIIRKGSFHSVIRTSGVIESSLGNQTTITSTSEGIITFNSNYTPGCSVSKGQALAHIHAGMIAGGDPALKAKAEYEAAKAEYERDLSLIDEKIVSRKHLEEHELAFRMAEAAYAVYSADGKGAVLKSTASGYITRLLVANGESVSVGQPIAVVSDGGKSVLRADIPLRQARLAESVVSANFTPSSSETVFSLANLRGKLLSYDKSVNQGGGMSVYFTFDNPGGLMTGEFASIWLLGKEETGKITVPESALIEEQGVYSVIVKINDDDYRKQVVSTGNTDGQRREITEGLSEGDEVVVKGAVLVKMASFSGAVPGHTHNH